MFWLGLAIGIAGGGFVAWKYRDPLLLWYKGAEDRIGELNDQIKSIKSKI